jgi:hypothetical protein
METIYEIYENEVVYTFHITDKIMYVNWDYNKKDVHDLMKIENILWNNDELLGCLWVDTFKAYMEWQEGEELEFYVEKCVWGTFRIYQMEEDETNTPLYMFYDMVKIDKDGYLNIFDDVNTGYKLLNCLYNDDLVILKDGRVLK